MKCFLALAVVLCFNLPGPAQDLTNEMILQNLANMNKNPALRPLDKLNLLYGWKNKSDALHLPKDSVYATLLHRIGVFEFIINKNYFSAISFTERSLQINTSRKPGSSIASALTDYYNLGYYFDKMNLSNKALNYYDSAILFAKSNGDIDNTIADSRVNKAFIFFRMGDYEKAVEESDLGVAAAIENKDSLHYLFFLNQRAQSLFFQNNIEPALADVQIAIPLAQHLDRPFDLASAWKTKGLIFAGKRNFQVAEDAFKHCIAERIKSKLFWQVASDYNDFGNFYSDSLQFFDRAVYCFTTSIQYAKKEGDSTRMARASLNLGRTYFRQQKLKEAMDNYQQAFRLLNISKGQGFLQNPPADQLSPIGNKELLQTLFNSKTELLLELFKESHEEKWLQACLQTALINDSLITQIRHEQLGEQSKLYWRNSTRGFFAVALEACYLAKDYPHAFFFMEKSRAVLLQDKLNELTAKTFLPPDEKTKKEDLQVRIIELQEKLGSVMDTSAGFKNLKLELLQAKEELEQYIKTLEKKYPAYYQFKYADETNSLAELQKFLGNKKQQFVEYFIEDSSSYALFVTDQKTEVIKLNNGRQDMKQLLFSFINFCSNEKAQNKNFQEFLRMSNKLYQLMMAPFDLQSGRVIICQDNWLFPFEALSSDSLRPDFLIRNYAFSYVYSARFLMNQNNNVPGSGDFLGIAPVHFKAGMEVPNLVGSENALKKCSQPFNRTHLLFEADANRLNFLQQLSEYNTTTILTHAVVDSLEPEPFLILHDSVIHLSELQMLQRTASKLVVLSGCRTNLGRNEIGEGIFSLARGFSSVGIPSVAATQWEADENAMYTVSEKFNEHLAGGMNKDEALQKAKLFYMDQGRKNMLPYYWADMVLVGNADPVQFSTVSKMNWHRLFAILILGSILFLIIRYRKMKPRLKA